MSAPRRENTTNTDLQHSRDGAISKNSNPRNYEYIWYMFWSAAARRLADALLGPACHVAPQFPLWIVPNATIDHPDNMLQHNVQPGERIKFDDPDSSFGSVANTIVTIDAKRLVDFALVIWLKGKKDEKELWIGEKTLASHSILHFPPPDPESVLSMKPLEIIPTLIEIKRYPPRDFMKFPYEWIKRVDMNIDLARKDVLVQAAYLFASSRWNTQRSVLVIAACGEWWSYTIVHKGTIVSRQLVEDEDEEFDPDVERVPGNNKSRETAKLVVEGWKGPVQYGSNGHVSLMSEVIQWAKETFHLPGPLGPV